MIVRLAYPAEHVREFADLPPDAMRTGHDIGASVCASLATLIGINLDNDPDGVVPTKH